MRVYWTQILICTCPFIRCMSARQENLYSHVLNDQKITVGDQEKKIDFGIADHPTPSISNEQRKTTL